MNSMIDLEIIKSYLIEPGVGVLALNDSKIVYSDTNGLVFYDIVIATQKFFQLQPGQIITKIEYAPGNFEDFEVVCIMSSTYPYVLLIQEESSKLVRTDIEAKEFEDWTISHLSFSHSADFIPCIISKDQNDALLLLNRKSKKPHKVINLSLFNFNYKIRVQGFINFSSNNSFLIYSEEEVRVFGIDRSLEIVLEWRWEESQVSKIGVCRNLQILIIVVQRRIKIFKNKYLTYQKGEELEIEDIPDCYAFCPDFAIMGFRLPYFLLLQKKDSRITIRKYQYKCQNFAGCQAVSLSCHGEIILFKLKVQYKRNNITSLLQRKLVTLLSVQEQESRSQSTETVAQGVIIATIFKNSFDNFQLLSIDIIDNLFSPEIHIGDIRKLCTQRWQQNLFTIASDHTLRCFDIKSQKIKFGNYLAEEPLSLSLHPTVPLLAIRFAQSFKVYNILNRGIIQVYGEMTKRCCSVCYSQFGAYLCVAGFNLIQIFNSFSMEKKYLLNIQGRLRQVRFADMDHSLLVFFKSNVIASYFFEESFQKNYQIIASPHYYFVQYVHRLDLLLLAESEAFKIFTDKGTFEAYSLSLLERETITSVLLVKEINVFFLGNNAGKLRIFNLRQIKSERDVQVSACSISSINITEDLKTLMITVQGRGLVFFKLNMLKDGDLLISDDLYYSYRKFMDNKIFYPTDQFDLCSSAIQRQKKVKLVNLKEERDNAFNENKEQIQRYKKSLTEQVQQAKRNYRKLVQENNQQLNVNIIAARNKKAKKREELTYFIDNCKMYMIESVSEETKDKIQNLYNQYNYLLVELVLTKNKEIQIQPPLSPPQQNCHSQLLHEQQLQLEKEAKQMLIVREQLSLENKGIWESRVGVLNNTWLTEKKKTESIRINNLKLSGKIRLLEQKNQSLEKIYRALLQDLQVLIKEKERFMQDRVQIEGILSEKDCIIRKQEEEISQISSQKLKLTQKITYFSQFIDMMEKENLISVEKIENELLQKQRQLFDSIQEAHLYDQKLAAKELTLQQKKHYYKTTVRALLNSKRHRDNIKFELSKVLNSSNHYSSSVLRSYLSKVIEKYSPTRYVIRNEDEGYSQKKRINDRQFKTVNSFDRLFSQQKIFDSEYRKRCEVQHVQLIKTVNSLRVQQGKLRECLLDLKKDLDQAGKFKFDKDSRGIHKVSIRKLPFEIYKQTNKSKSISVERQTKRSYSEKTIDKFIQQRSRGRQHLNGVSKLSVYDISTMEAGKTIKTKKTLHRNRHVLIINQEIIRNE